MPGTVSTALVNRLTAERDSLRQSITSELAREDAGQPGTGTLVQMVREAGILTAALAELSAVGA